MDYSTDWDAYSSRGYVLSSFIAEQGAEHFMATSIAAEKVRAGLRHVAVRPNVTGRTKERIARSKRASAGLLAIALVD